MKKKVFSLVLAIIFCIGGGVNAFADTAICFGSSFSETPNTSGGGARNTIPSTLFANRKLTSMGYDSTAVIQPTSNLLNEKNDDGTRITESTVLYFNGEGTGKSIGWWYPFSATGSDRKDYCGVTTKKYNKSGFVQLNASSNNLRNVKLAMLFGCQSADMAYAIMNSGNNKPASILGFMYDVNSKQLQIWANRYMSGLKEGMTVDKARQYCNSFDDYQDSRLKDNNIYGNKNTTLSKNRVANTNIIESKDTGKMETEIDGKESYSDAPEDKEEDSKYENETKPVMSDLNKTMYFDFSSPNYTEIENYIKENIDSNFSTKYYVPEALPHNGIHGDKGGVIECTLMMGDYKTDIGYTINVDENGVISSIGSYNVPENIDKYINYSNSDLINSNKAVENVDIEALKKKAINQEFLKAGFQVIEQRVVKKIDPDTLQKSITILTDYYEPDNGVYDCDDYTENID